jgi:tetratricopeptide (TPR) repeat protein
MQKDNDVRATFAILLLLMTMAPTSADDLLLSGRKELRAGRYADAVKDLGVAADSVLTPQQVSKYIRTGHYEALADYEEALVYLTIADMKLGRVADARDAVRRITVAERVEPTYQALLLDADAAEFESMARKLLPESPLPPNRALAEMQQGRHHRREIA